MAARESYGVTSRFYFDKKKIVSQTGLFSSLILLVVRKLFRVAQIISLCAVISYSRGPGIGQPGCMVASFARGQLKREKCFFLVSARA